MNNEIRYSFFDHPNKPNWFRVVDIEKRFYCDFEKHKFNETQEVHGMEDWKDAQKIAKELREMGDWLFWHHYSDVFPIPKYELKLDYDDKALRVIRHTEPFMDARFLTTDLDDVANSLSKASEFIRKIAKRHNNQ